MRQRGMDSSSSWTAHGGMTSACAGVSMENALKEHRTFECVQLFSPELHGGIFEEIAHAPVKEPVDGMDECARGVFLRARRPSGTFSSTPRTRLRVSQVNLLGWAECRMATGKPGNLTYSNFFSDRVLS